MTAILGGLAAAGLWATSTLTSSRTSRTIGPSSTVAWMLTLGILICVPMTLLSGPLPPLTQSLALAVVGSGACGVVGMLLVNRGLRIGPVGVVSALCSTEGAIAAVLSVMSGERLTIVAAAMLGLIALGIAAVAFATNTAESDADGRPVRTLHQQRRAVLFGVAAAFCFGLSIYCTARAGQTLPPFAAVLPLRVAGLFVLIPMAATRTLRMTRQAAPLILLIAVVDILGNVFYVIGARQSVAVSAVVASQFAALTAIAAFILFHERLSSQQRSGVVAIAVGVAILTALRS